MFNGKPQAMGYAAVAGVCGLPSNYNNNLGERRCI